jgi:hypothetical protein
LRQQDGSNIDFYQTMPDRCSAKQLQRSNRCPGLPGQS